MTVAVRLKLKSALRRRGFELVLPADRSTIGWGRYIRLRRFELPEPVRAHMSGGVFEVELSRMVNRVGFGYGPDGWHPYVAALDERLADPDRPYEASVLARFYAAFRPRNVHDLLLGGAPLPHGILASWPAVDGLIDVWSVTAAKAHHERYRYARPAPLPECQYRGPMRHDDGAHHLQRVVDFYEQARRIGYRPEEFSAGHITGYFLIGKDDYVFVVGGGNHRAAAFMRLGIERVPVMLRAGHPPVVDTNDLRRWTREHGGLLDPSEASAVAQRLLARDSRSRAAALGLR